MNIFIEYDNKDLSTIVNQLANLFKNLNYNVILLDNNMSLNDKIQMIKKYNNSFILSNKNNNNNSIEIIYPLRDNNTLASSLNNNLSKITNVSKFYQLRSNTNTNLDYYELLRNISGNDALLIKYGQMTNEIARTIAQTINDYLDNKNIYIVKSGDSLYKIAKKYNSTVDELKRINNLSSNLLSIGQKLIIPSNNSNNIDETIYIVKSGDSLYKIAKEYNSTVDKLKRINNLSSNLLSIGQKLIIPNSETSIIYTVIKGDSLYKIAKEYNSTVDKIKKDNNLTSNLLSIGQKLIIKK